MQISIAVVAALLFRVAAAADPVETVQPATSPPVIPIGVDAYRMWSRWAYQQIGARAYMRSTYDRRGGNETADASHFLYQEAEDFNVTLDVEGSGVLCFARYNHWHGSPWHYEVDGTDHVVQETTTSNPLVKLEHSTFLPASLFPQPLTWTYATTKGADLMWVPIPFEERFRMAYSRTFYGTGYYIFRHYVRGAALSQPIKSWDASKPPDADVLELLSRSGTDIAPEPDTSEGKRLGVRELSGGASIPAAGVIVFATIGDGPYMVRALKISVPRADAVRFGKSRIRVTWDGRTDASIDASVSLFFGTGTLYNRDDREYLVKAFPMSVRFDRDRVFLACYFPMPFFREAKFELIGSDDQVTNDVRWSLRFHPFVDPPNHVGYFHATFRDHGDPIPGKDLVFLDTHETEGGADWSGSFVGTSFIFTDNAILNTLEGDPRFFFDDSQTPQAYGTGTEEWGGGGDYWGGRTMTLPFAGHPVGVRRPELSKGSEDLIHSAYRFLLADLMPFGKRAVIRFEHGGVNQSKEHYRSVTYWYGLPSASLVQTDELDVGIAQSERAHDYVSPDASAPYELNSRYEWGPDHANIGGEDVEVYPAHSEIGRKTTTYSEFTVKLRQDNLGALLRRTLDYKFPNQRAKVYVAATDASPPEWRMAGVWYLAGSNTCYHSFPAKQGELGRSQPVVQTSNRRFRDDEFLIPRDLTAKRSEIRVRVEFTPVEVPLLPGRPLDELAWSEIRYKAYSYVMPTAQPPGE